MSLYSDFYPQDGGTDLVPGIVQDTTSGYIADGINYLDINNGILIDKSLYLDLDTNLFVPNYTTNTLEQTHQNPNPGIGDFFGESLAIQGDTMVIGAYRDDLAGLQQGRVYIYTRTAGVWSIEQTINNPTPVDYDYFGNSVSLDGDTLVIGAYLDDISASNAGNVYVYTRSAGVWTLEQEINNPTPIASDQFGYSVGINGDTLAIGAPNEDTGLSDAGSVYIYTRSGTTWTLEKEINNPNPMAGAEFGIAISLDIDRILIGAHSYEGTLGWEGEAYVFTRVAGIWTLEQTISPPIPTANAYFGWRVHLHGEVLVVGANWDSLAGTDSGAVYVYRLVSGTWTLEQSIGNPNPTANDEFGSAVHIDNDILVVGALGQDDTNLNDGSVYIYTRIGATWSLIQKIDNPTPEAGGDQFGSGLKFDNGTLLVAAYMDNTAVSDAGIAYTFTFPDSNTFYIQGQDQVLKVTI
jgi:hypothetical protein